MITLWTEKHRPDTLDGYVFTDQNQRAQIEKWIAEKEIPHLMFSGSAGTGKCLGGEEQIRIKIDVDQLTEHQRAILKPYI